MVPMVPCLDLTSLPYHGVHCALPCSALDDHDAFGAIHFLSLPYIGTPSALPCLTLPYHGAHALRCLIMVLCLALPCFTIVPMVPCFALDCLPLP